MTTPLAPPVLADEPAEPLRIVKVAQAELYSDMVMIESSLLDRLCDRLNTVATQRDALLAQARQGREDAERLREDAARWQYVRRFLTVERDLTDHVEYLYWGETEEVQAPINEHTVESLVDLAVCAATPSPSPEGGR